MHHLSDKCRLWPIRWSAPILDLIDGKLTRHILSSFRRGKDWKFIFTSRHRQGSVNKLLDGWSSIRWKGWCAIVHDWAKVIGKPDVSLVPGFQYSAVFLIRLEMFESLKFTWQTDPPCPSQYFPTRSWHACPDQFWDENNHLPFIAVIYLDCSCQKPNVWRSSCKTTPWWRQPGPREITWDVFLLFQFKTQLLEKPGVHLIDQRCCSSPWNISHLYQGKDFVVFALTDQPRCEHSSVLMSAGWIWCKHHILVLPSRFQLFFYLDHRTFD